MQLSPEQKLFFSTFGYLKLPGLFVDDMPQINEAFTRTVAANAADIVEWRHQAHGGLRRRALPQFIDRDDYLSSLVDDPRIDGIFRSLMGDSYQYRGSDANLFECTTCWHSDTYGALLDYRNVKIIFYLDKLGPETGCFRVLPGSHLFGDQYANRLTRFLGSNDSYMDTLGVRDDQVPAQIVPTEPGDVLLFDFRVKHATCSSDPQLRRMFTICAAEYIRDEDVPRLRQEIAMGAKFGLKHYYGERMVATAGANRMVHIAQCLANEDALSAAAD